MAQENQNSAVFDEKRISVEEWLALPEINGKYADVYPRRDQKTGEPLKNEKGQQLYTLASDNGKFAYVPHELGDKLTSNQKVGNMFMTKVTTPGYAEPMWMLCESRSVAHFTRD